MKKSLLNFDNLCRVANYSQRYRHAEQKLIACFAEGGGAGTKEFTELELKDFGNQVIAKFMENNPGLKDIPKLITDLKATKDELKTLETKAGKMFDPDSEGGKKMKEVNDALLEVKSLLEAPMESKEASTSPSEVLMDAFKAKELECKELQQNWGHSSGKGIKLELKALITESMLATIEAATSPYQNSLTSNTGIINKVRHRILTYLTNVSVGGLQIDKPYAMWMEEFDEEGTPIFIQEAVRATNLSINYREERMQAMKIAVYTKITLEFFRNLPQLVSFVQNNLIKRVDLVTENQLFSGTGPGNTQIQGAFSYAVPFTGGGVTGTTFVNEIDVLNALGVQCMQNNHVPTGVFVNIALRGVLSSKKDTIGNYLYPPDTDWDNVNIGGMKLIFTSAWGASTALENAGNNENLANAARLFLGGDLSVINVSFLEGMTVQIGLDGTDFTQDLKTLLVEQILVQFVPANDVTGLITGNFDTAMGMIG